MKTADTIEAQEERESARDNPDQRPLSPENRQSVRQKGKRGDASRIAAWRFKPGQTGNPGGRPKHDLASEIARACFEENAEALFKAFSKALLRGNGYVFKELADRAYGRLKETHHLDISPYKDVPTQDLEQPIKRLEVQLGYRKAEEGVPVLPPASESKPN